MVRMSMLSAVAFACTVALPAEVAAQDNSADFTAGVAIFRLDHATTQHAELIGHLTALISTRFPSLPSAVVGVPAEWLAGRLADADRQSGGKGATIIIAADPLNPLNLLPSVYPPGDEAERRFNELVEKNKATAERIDRNIQRATDTANEVVNRIRFW